MKRHRKPVTHPVPPTAKPPTLAIPHSRIALIAFFIACAVGCFCLAVYASNRNRRQGGASRLIQGRRRNKRREQEEGEDYNENDNDDKHDGLDGKHKDDDCWGRKSRLKVRMMEEGWRAVEEEEEKEDGKRGAAVFGTSVGRWVVGALHRLGRRAASVYGGGASRGRFGVFEGRLPLEKDVERGGASAPYGYAYHAYGGNGYGYGYGGGGGGSGVIGGQVDGFQAAGEKAARVGDVGATAWKCGTFAADPALCRLRRNGGGGTMTVESSCPV